MSPLNTRGKLAVRLKATEPRVRVIYVSTYIPRECGIATYTKDLTNAINLLNPYCLADIVAIDDRDMNKTNYRYPWEVKYKIQQNSPKSWREAAAYINQSSAEIVHFQHEFGIYSSSAGSAGEHAVLLAEAVNKPIVVTFHTVLPRPSKAQLASVRKLAKLATAITVMVGAAVKLLVDVYGIDEKKIVVIPHGVPDIGYTTTKGAKEYLGLGDATIISGFGLLSEGKGYEYAIEAMPAIVKQNSNVKLLIIGETHPVVLRHQGEAYRHKLHALIKKLKLSRSVKMVNRYLTLGEIIDYLKATDIYITPFLGLEQITSGTLSYAIGAGKVCVTTPYRYAEEVVDDDRGVLVPPRDSCAMAATINDLLAHPRKCSIMSKKAYAYGRNMIWPSVALRHLDLFEIVKKVSYARA
ncbi:MAG: glycosyltransferase family 4 protein [Candidatus Berkelbacteria bacterium]|nr:MAG: glycosyltransferase family 4 protein [Candidatus Berkelbacteria bacterium]QQG51916.1 MAG: glycosyltransferase family 4 protein [Candidatus Berkelbacteria bacterium]